MSKQTNPNEIKDYIKNELKKCMNDPVYFMKKYCKIQHPIKGKIPFELYPFQEQTLRELQENRFNIILKSRQLGISTLTAGFSLWMAMFQSDKSIGILATKLLVATNLTLKITEMVKTLPKWMLSDSDTSQTKNKSFIQLTEDNKLTKRFSNGSQIRAFPCTTDAARSEAFSCIFIDECQSAENQLVIKNKQSNEIFNITIGELFNINKSELNENNYKPESKYQVLTPTGFQDFDGIKKTSKKEYVCLTILNKDDKKTEFKCSLNHKLKLIDNEFMYAGFLKKGDILANENKVLYKKSVSKEIELYDLINVNNGNEYISNNSIVNHNCAFIEENIIVPLWTSIGPTLSTGGRAVILSTPNGKSGLFYRLCADAEEHRNNFNLIKLKWTVHPDRDQKWRDEQDVMLGKQQAAQECDISFTSSGNTVIDNDILIENESNICEPIEKRGLGQDLWIWKYPDYTRDYMICSDCARGDSSDYSAFHVIDLTNNEQVAEFKGDIDTASYGHLIYNIATEYNNAYVVVENANVGWAVLQKLIDLNYENLHYTFKDMQIADVDVYLKKKYDLKQKEDMVAGFTTSMKTRPVIISTLVQHFQNKEFIYHSVRLKNELDVFIWKNGKAQAASGYNDDLIMSLAIGLWIRQTSLKLKFHGIELMKSALNSMVHIKPIIKSNNGLHNPYRMNISNSSGRHNTEIDLKWLL